MAVKAFSGAGTELPPSPEYFNEMASSGLRVYGGFVRDEFQQQLAGRNKYRIYREMADNSATIGSLLYAIKMIIRSLELRVEPAEDAPNAEEMADFVYSIMDDMVGSWDGFMTDALTFLENGFAPVEVVYKRRSGLKKDPMKSSKHDDGYVGVAKMGLRSQETIIKWLMDDHANITGLQQQPFNAPMVEIPVEKFLLFRTSEERNNPEGRSLIRNTWRAWYFQKRLEEIEAIGTERDLAGLPVILVPSSVIQAAASSDAVNAPKALATLNAYKTMAVNIRRDEQEGVVMPSDRDEHGNLQYELKLLTSGGSRQFDTNALITRYKNDILATVLADFIMMGQAKVGSQALAVTKVKMFMNAVQGMVNIIAAVLNRQLLPRLWSLNGFDQQAMPKFVFEKVDKPDLDILGGYIKALSDAGFSLAGDHETEEVARAAAGLPPPPEDGLLMQDFQGGLMEDAAKPPKSVQTETPEVDGDEE